jgi:hypothetical protein
MTTKHTCGGPAFGRKTPGCPRCDELLAGAAPVQWAGSRVARDNRLYRGERERHFAPGGPHATGKCGPVCTAFDW